jgi:hypothetical protein
LASVIYSYYKKHMNIPRTLENFQKYLWVARQFNSPYIIKIGVKVSNKPDFNYTSMGKTQSCFISLRSNNLFDTFISFHELKLDGGGWVYVRQ